MSDKSHDFGSLVCIYAQLLPRIREAGKKLGYAIAIHGSMQRDLDLLAVPWTEDAGKAEALVEEIKLAVGGYVIGDEKDTNFQRGVVSEKPTLQPHGRKSWNICWGGRPFIDLSVMPRGPKRATEEATLTSEDTMPNPITDPLAATVAANTAVIGSAIALINGIADRINKAVADALAGGATAQEVADAVTAVTTAIQTDDAKLAAAVQANTVPPAPTPQAKKTP